MTIKSILHIHIIHTYIQLKWINALKIKKKITTIKVYLLFNVTGKYLNILKIQLIYVIVTSDSVVKIRNYCARAYWQVCIIRIQPVALIQRTISVYLKTI